MRKWLILSATMALLLSCCIGTFLVCVDLSQTSSQPSSCESVARLYVANPTVDLGSLPQGETRDVVFRMVNQGNRRLIINQVDRTCCGEPVRDSVMLAPGAHQDWVCKIDTSHQVGPLGEVTSFTTNDPTQPRFELRVTARVQPSEHQHDSNSDDPQRISVLVDR